MLDSSQPWRGKADSPRALRGLAAPFDKDKEEYGYGEFVGLKLKTEGGSDQWLFSLQGGGSFKELL